MLDFYYAPGTIALATHIALEDAGAEYQAHLIDFSKEMQKSPDYLKVNPKGRVPALVTPEGILTETPAMLAYVAQSYPAASLAPLDDPFAFAQIQSVNAYICSTLHVAHAHRMRGHRWTDDPATMASLTKFVPEAVGASFQHIEDHILVGPYVMGESYSIADPYLFTVTRWMESDGVDPAKFPKISAHHELMAGRESVQKALKMELG